MATPTCTRGSSPRSRLCSASPTPMAPSSLSIRARAPSYGRHRSRCARRRAAAPPRRRAACRATCRAAYHLASVLAPRHALGRPAAPASHTSPRCPLVARRPSRTPSSLLPSRQVWVNGRSASSSEVLAGALHDNCRASVVGSRSFGKGLIQGVFGLSDGGALVTTVASYATPNGREINLQGAAACSETRPPGCGRASHLRLEAPPLLRTVALCAPGRVWAAWARQCSPGATLRRRQRRWFRWMWPYRCSCIPTAPPAT